MTQALLEKELPLEQAIPALETTPGVLRSLFAALPDEWIDFQEEPEAWSPRAVLRHLVHNESVNWIPRARVILSDREDRKFVPFQSLPTPEEVQEADGPRLAAEFARRRQESVRALRSLGVGPQDYERTGEHPKLGTVTLGQLLATWVVHDWNHVHQIVKTLSKRQADAVGPWRKYLAIIDA